MDEITEIDREVRRLRKRIFELNKRRIGIKKQRKQTRKSAPPEILAISVKSLDFSTRVKNAFANNNIETLGDILQYSANDFLRKSYYAKPDEFCSNNFGVKSLQEVTETLLSFGLTLKDDE
jgi:DNA-directed RNA polymerase alpha subunit